jgi:hypothetical protein
VSFRRRIQQRVLGGNSLSKAFGVSVADCGRRQKVEKLKKVMEIPRKAAEV